MLSVEMTLLVINPECSTALRFGQTYCANSEHILPATSTGVSSAVAIETIFSIGSNPNSSSLLSTWSDSFPIAPFGRPAPFGLFIPRVKGM